MAGTPQHTACAKATRCRPDDAQILGIDPAVTCIILQAEAMARGIALAVEGTTTEGGELRRVVAAAVLGNALEWYDFVIYSFLASTIASIFFPDSDEVAALLATFGIGFLARPFGAIVVGWNARDRRHGTRLKHQYVASANSASAMA
jgi:hypothetical protein